VSYYAVISGFVRGVGPRLALTLRL